MQVGCVEGPGSRQRGTGEELGFLLGVQPGGWVFLFFRNDGAGGREVVVTGGELSWKILKKREIRELRE